MFIACCADINVAPEAASTSATANAIDPAAPEQQGKNLQNLNDKKLVAKNLMQGL
jgi:hypothetical protein